MQLQLNGAGVITFIRLGARFLHRLFTVYRIRQYQVQ